MEDLKESGSKMSKTTLVKKFGKTEPVMKVFTKMDSRTEKDVSNGLIMNFMKESFFRTESKAMEYTIGQTDQSIKEIG